MGSKIEINTYFGQCTCCLGYAYLKSMWDKHERNGRTESYAVMLFECFGLNTWYTEDENQDRICEGCITKLRDACQFKAQVLKIQEYIQNEGVEIKKESIETEYDMRYEGTDDDFDDIEYLDEELLKLNNGVEERVTRKRRRRQSDATDFTSRDDTDVVDDIQRQRKWPKKLPANLRYQTYKQYTADDLRDCLEAIKQGVMSVKNASAFYKIPFKTVAAKIRSGILEEEDPIPLTKTRELIEDIKTILQYTNVTPFKSRFNRIMCAFCSNSCSCDELRTHTVDEHPNRVTRVEAMLRPYYENQMLKIDIQDLKCKICDIPALYWTDMLHHLTSKHNIYLNQARTNIIPYILSENIYCAICNEHFSTFMLVDAHMNSHYNNYSCSDCGETFITIPRLKNHEKIHETGKYPCYLCDKVFPLKSYRKKHILLIHERNSLMYKCSHCSERFKNESLRQKHMISSHSEKIQVINCEICGTIFYFNKQYKKHLRRKHNLENSCQICGKIFESEFLLNEHKLRHINVKEFNCEVCKKSYFTKTSLKYHLRLHDDKVGKDLKGMELSSFVLVD